jgi:hypothetical protein
MRPGVWRTPVYKIGGEEAGMVGVGGAVKNSFLENLPPTTPELSTTPEHTIVGRPTFEPKEPMAGVFRVEWKVDRWVASVKDNKAIASEGATKELALWNLLTEKGEEVLNEIGVQFGAISK